MTSELMELLRNLYGAGGGTVPASAWTMTIATLLWMSAYDDAPADEEYWNDR